jgi:pimeloyl-ACP methyl ester carboxylesterase
MSHTVYRQADVDGVSVFYREAGPADAPAILALHGFPSSSRMWEPPHRHPPKHLTSSQAS